MDRRRYLTLLGAGIVGGVAGCTGDGTEQVDNPETTRETTAADTTAATTEETTEQTTEETTTEAQSSGEADVRTSNSELVEDDSGYSTRKYVEATVSNEGDAASGQVTLTARWYDDNGDLLDDSSERLPSLGAGETWIAHVYALTTDAENIADYELDGEFETEAPKQPNDVELVESSHQVSEDSATVTGRATNNGDDALDYLEAQAKLYDDQGRVLSGNYTNESDVPAGETWRFNVEWIQFDRPDEVGDHEVLLDATVY